MEYRQSSIWPVQVDRAFTGYEKHAAQVLARANPTVSSTPVDWRAATSEEVDTHMKGWADAGWELVSANLAIHNFGIRVLPVYAFFWSHP